MILVSESTATITTRQALTSLYEIILPTSHMYYMLLYHMPHVPYAAAAASGGQCLDDPACSLENDYFLEQMKRLTGVVHSLQSQQTILQSTLTQLMSSQGSLNRWPPNQPLSYYH